MSFRTNLPPTYGRTPTPSQVANELAEARCATKDWWKGIIHQSLLEGRGSVRGLSIVLDNVIDAKEAVKHLESALVDLRLSGYHATLDEAVNLGNARPPKTGSWYPPRVEITVVRQKGVPGTSLSNELAEARHATKDWWVESIHQCLLQGRGAVRNLSIVLDNVLDAKQAVKNLESALVDFRLNGFRATLDEAVNLGNAKPPKTGSWYPPRVEITVVKQKG